MKQVEGKRRSARCAKNTSSGTRPGTAPALPTTPRGNPPPLDRGGDVVMQDQIYAIGLRDDHTLRAGEPARLCRANAIEPLDLPMSAADRLGAPLLIDRSGDRQILA